MSDFRPLGEEYAKGYSAGLSAGFDIAMSNTREPMSIRQRSTGLRDVQKPKRKRTQSPKQKLLKQMTDKKWSVYKRGSGKKTYIQIRGEVSRSQAYKKKAKRL
jgi:hypothetical protein